MKEQLTEAGDRELSTVRVARPVPNDILNELLNTDEPTAKGRVLLDEMRHSLLIKGRRRDERSKEMSRFT
jgi:hypothetical protein